MKTKTIFTWVILFSIAMGFLESAVVIYLRKIYYPAGFDFPVVSMANDVVVVEVWREAATIIMLLAIGIIAGRNKAERLALFLFAFAVWDIFYYVFLYVFLGWPQSLFTWDILFLIPVPWVGPVAAPVTIALTMIVYAVIVVRYSDKQVNAGLQWRERILLLCGGLVVIAAFTEDYWRQRGAVFLQNAQPGNSPLPDLAHYVPVHFDWLVFWLGEGLIMLALLQYAGRVRKSCPAWP